jgi:hypothetical protein
MLYASASGYKRLILSKIADAEICVKRCKDTIPVGSLYCSNDSGWHYEREMRSMQIGLRVLESDFDSVSPDYEEIERFFKGYRIDSYALEKGNSSSKNKLKEILQKLQNAVSKEEFRFVETLDLTARI